MNGWPTDDEVKNALEQGILLNVCRAAPYPGETDKSRIARGMTIAGFGTIPVSRMPLVDWIDDRIMNEIENMMRGNDWHAIIAAGMSSR